MQCLGHSDVLCLSKCLLIIITTSSSLCTVLHAAAFDALHVIHPQALMHSEPYVHALGALTGNMAMQQVHTQWHCAFISCEAHFFYTSCLIHMRRSPHALLLAACLPVWHCASQHVHTALHVSLLMRCMLS